MKEYIGTIEGENPIAFYVKDEIVKVVLDEFKISKKVKSIEPFDSIQMIKSMYGLKEIDIIGFKEDYLNSIEPYSGLHYANKFVMELVQRHSFMYKLYIHDPKDPRFTTPNKFFNDIQEIIKSGKKVGYFQGKWRIGNGLDLNRCIIQQGEFQTPYRIKEANEVFTRTVEGLKVEVINLYAYHPIEALRKLKDKVIDVLVIGNLIVTNNKGEKK